MSVFYCPPQTYNSLWRAQPSQYVSHSTIPQSSIFFNGNQTTYIGRPADIQTVNPPAAALPSTFIPSNPVFQVVDDVSLKAAVEINRREVMDPEQLELRLMDSFPQLQSPAIFMSSTTLDLAPSPTLFVPAETFAEPAQIYGTSYYPQLTVAAEKSSEIKDLEHKIRRLEDERQALQAKLAQTEAAHQSARTSEQQGLLKARSLQSSVLAMQQSMSQQAAQLGGLQQQLSQQQREAQAWAREVQAARAQLRRQQDDHQRDMDSLRGAHPPPPSPHTH